MQDTWLEDFDHSSNEAYFTISSNGWTNGEIGLAWIKIFDRYTKAKAGNARRLLIVDGHSSHVNLRFINYCDNHRILLVILPPHSTHRLQPLDVGIFSSLANAYSQELDRLIQSSHGFTRITKRHFWRLFSAAWTYTVTAENIKSAFAAPGITPLDPSKILSILKMKMPSPASSDNESKRKTPTSVRGLRRIIKQIYKEEAQAQARLTAGTSLVIRASQKLAVQNEVLLHENKALCETLVQEKKRRKRGKAMGLFDKERAGEAQFFSPAKVATVRQRAEDIEAENRRQKALTDETASESYSEG